VQAFLVVGHPIATSLAGYVVPRDFESAAGFEAGLHRFADGGAIHLVDWSPSLHDQEHGEQDDGAYQDSGKEISRVEQGPQVIGVDRYRLRRFALR
jgi:hypothetical protein